MYFLTCMQQIYKLNLSMCLLKYVFVELGLTPLQSCGREKEVKPFQTFWPP